MYALFLLELAQSICLVIEAISTIALGRPANFYWVALYIISPITCAATQAYYANHIVSLSRRHLWSGWIGTVSVGRANISAFHDLPIIAWQFCALNILSGTLTGVSLAVSGVGMQVICSSTLTPTVIAATAREEWAAFSAYVMCASLFSIDTFGVLTASPDLARPQHTRRRADSRVDEHLGTLALSPAGLLISLSGCTNPMLLPSSAAQDKMDVLWPIDGRFHTTCCNCRRDWQSNWCAIAGPGCP